MQNACARDTLQLPHMLSNGPGIEFVEYLAPLSGQPYPPDEQANDLIHWQTRFAGSSVAQAAREFQQSRSRMISSGVVELSAGEAPFQKSIVVRDPDGHAIQLVQK